MENSRRRTDQIVRYRKEARGTLEYDREFFGADRRLQTRTACGTLAARTR
jgi:hypothetical protein